ncbi:hypothetical protein NQ314_009800 [Rhamnusium bicolor]|uniref:MULE transposase domain-containing protein n=1 Tax=Rhamnusium bicolor TaxID=1586634 RepID=A0AAV8XVX3_9CUCU|nr:hypothetical protein NQ314_009800 [Rhamnusium bicolor]
MTSQNIIAVDSTHGLNSYDFELSTVLIVDDWGEDFPDACLLLTNRQDSVIFENCFDAIKSKLGLLKPKTFMSDITNVFYKAWFRVMGLVPNQLFCAWHIDRAWQTNLSKITDSEK